MGIGLKKASICSAHLVHLNRIVFVKSPPKYSNKICDNSATLFLWHFNGDGFSFLQAQYKNLLIQAEMMELRTRVSKQKHCCKLNFLHLPTIIFICAFLLQYRNYAQLFELKHSPNSAIFTLKEITNVMFFIELHVEIKTGFSV